MRTLLFRLSALMVGVVLLCLWLAVEARNALAQVPEVPEEIQ